MNRAGGGDADPESLAVVVFTHRGWRMGVEARLVAGLGLAEGPARPRTQAQPSGVDDPEGLAPLRPLRLKKSGRVVLVGEPVELVSLPAGCVHPLPPLVAARATLGGLRALALAPGLTGPGLVVLCDPEGLFAPEAEPGACVTPGSD